ncbi:MAG: RidA family protein [Betaproteobacteria bacterium]|nr:MAG: RidA family protein [Betaproteobacteria bacterium]
MAKQFHNPEPFRSEHRPYAMAVKAGKLVFLAGQLGVEFVDGKRTVVAPGDAERQIETIFINMRAVLEDVGAGLADIWMRCAAGFSARPSSRRQPWSRFRGSLCLVQSWRSMRSR